MHECADPVADCLDLRTGKEVRVAGNRDRRRPALVSNEHRRGDAFAIEIGAVIEFARVSVVAWETDSRRRTHSIADTKFFRVRNRYAHQSRHRRDIAVGKGAALSIDAAVGATTTKVFGRTRDRPLERYRRIVGESMQARGTEVGRE